MSGANIQAWNWEATIRWSYTRLIQEALVTSSEKYLKIVTRHNQIMYFVDF